MELNIFFKNVGQGDTILLDWKSEDNEALKYALIDCKKTNGNINPVINHIRKKDIKEFEFVLMSHPHSDHFSGFKMLFDYCENNNIIINRFFYTAAFSPDYLRNLLKDKMDAESFREFTLSSVNYGGNKQTLQDIFDKIMKEEEKGFPGFLKSITQINDVPFNLANDIQMRFLAPQNLELKKYIAANFDIVFNGALDIYQDKQNNPRANYLSSLIQIYNDKAGWQIFLSSDCTQETFSRIIGNNLLADSIRNKKLLGIQVPHHGSEDNHFKDFWDTMPERKHTPAVVSVGEGQGHPGKNVVEYFHENFLSIHATNFVGGFKEYYSNNDSQKSKRNDSILTMPGVTFNQQKKSKEKDNQGPPCGEQHLQIKVDANGPVCQILPV